MASSPGLEVPGSDGAGRQIGDEHYYFFPFHPGGRLPQ
jgi:hypothetical protein